MLLGLVWAVGMAWLDLRFPVLAGADCLLADSVAVCVGGVQPGNQRTTAQALEIVLDPRGIQHAESAGRYRRYLKLNRERILDDGFMHAVFNPSFNALATAMATARHRASHVLEIARDRHVEQALNETPEKTQS